MRGHFIGIIIRRVHPGGVRAGKHVRPAGRVANDEHGLVEVRYEDRARVRKRRQLRRGEEPGRRGAGAFIRFDEAPRRVGHELRLQGQRRVVRHQPIDLFLSCFDRFSIEILLFTVSFFAK